MTIQAPGQVTCVLLNPTVDHVCEVDGFKAGGTFKASATHVFPVGKAISVALGLKTLGENPRVISLVGRREEGLYREFLEQKGIASTLIPVDGKTRANTTIIDVRNQAVTHVREPGFHVGEGLFYAVKGQLASIGGSMKDWVVMSGSLPPGLPATTYKELIEVCKESGVKTCLDTSGEPLKRTMEGTKPNVLKVNHAELEYLLDLRDDDTEKGIGENQFVLKDHEEIAARAKSLLDETLEIVAVTMGWEGAMLVTNNAAIHGKIEVDRPINTVGSGDAFFAGMIHELLGKKPLKDTLLTALAAGAANTMVHGAGVFSLADVGDFLEEPREITDLL